MKKRTRERAGKSRIFEGTPDHTAPATGDHVPLDAGLRVTAGGQAPEAGPAASRHGAGSISSGDSR